MKNAIDKKKILNFSGLFKVLWSLLEEGWRDSTEKGPQWSTWASGLGRLKWEKALPELARDRKNTLRGIFAAIALNLFVIYFLRVHIYIYILFNLGCSSDDFLLNVLVGVIAVALANERSMYKKRCCCEVGCMLLATQSQKVSHMKMRYANEMFLENSYVQIHACIQNPIIWLASSCFNGFTWPCLVHLCVSRRLSRANGLPCSVRPMLFVLRLVY